MSHDLKTFLKPHCVAIIGASRDASKRGNRAIQMLLESKFAGRIVPINPKESEILSLPCYPDLASVPFDVDLALVCTPASSVPEVVRLCGEKGVKGALILAGGFGEASEAGAALEARVLDIARRHGVRLIGPNTNGMFDGHTGCNLVGWPGVYKGSLGVLSQSGNVALSFLAESQHNGHAGFTTFIGVGNEGDIRFHEYLRFFGDDPNTRAVMVYVEGFKDGRAFLEVAREVSRRKPVVVYKAGRTRQGEGAARSHSGSLVGDYSVSRGALRQAGTILVERSDEMFAVADALSRARGRAAKRVAILSEGGGPISQAADALAEQGLLLPRLAEDTERQLKKITPAATQLSNPVDVGGGTDPHPRYMPRCSRAMLADPAIDVLLIVGYFGGYQIRFGQSVAEAENAAAREVVAIAAESGKPVIVQCHYADFATEAISILRQANVVVVRSIESAASCLAAIDRFYEIARGRVPVAYLASQRTSEASEIVATAQAEGRNSLLEPEALRLLACHGVEVPTTALLTTPEGAAQLPDAFGQAPVALKVVSKDVLHKSDVGGVRLGIVGKSTIQENVASLVSDIGRRCPGAEIAGVLVMPMAKKGIEVILGTTVDRQFGPVMLFGLGGIFVEVIKDVAFRTLPISPADADELMEDIRAKEILNGVRGTPPVDRQKVKTLMLHLSDIAMAYPEIVEIDLNPVIVSSDGYSVVDVRMILKQEDAAL
jgi:acyl-CoA synthetase (NDP forming)